MKKLTNVVAYCPINNTGKKTVKGYTEAATKQAFLFFITK